MSLAAATLTKQTAALALLPLAYLAWRTRRGSRSALLGAAFAVPIVVAAVAFGPARLRTLGVHGQRRLRRRERRDRYAFSNGIARTGWFLFGSAALVVLLPWAWRHRREDADLWLWLLSGAVAVLIGFRFFPHYYLQLLPPLALLATRALSSLGVERRRRVLPVVAGRRRCRGDVVRRSGVHRGDNRDTKIALDVATYVREHTASGERVLVWGQAPEVYWSSGRLPATRFATTGFVTGVSGGRPPSRVGARYAAPGAPSASTETSARRRPVLIADMSTADQRHADFAPPSRFPRFERFLRRGGWHRVATVDGVTILRSTGPTAHS